MLSFLFIYISTYSSSSIKLIIIIKLIANEIIILNDILFLLINNFKILSLIVLYTQYLISLLLWVLLFLQIYFSLSKYAIWLVFVLEFFCKYELLFHILICMPVGMIFRFRFVFYQCLFCLAHYFNWENYLIFEITILIFTRSNTLMINC